MPDMKHIHDFAVKWCDKFRDQNINYIDLVDHFMADDCAALGFEMDCGHAFSERYGQAANNHEAVVQVVDIEYFSAEDVPLPAEKTKYIIRKCTDEDFDLLEPE